MKVWDSDLKFLCKTTGLLSAIFGFTADNKLEWKQLQILQCCNSVCLSICMSVSVSLWD
jgi:hypothetical protein